MAVKNTSISLQAIYMAILMLTMGSNASNISIYWGQTKYEVSLGETCATYNYRLYKIVNLAFLYSFGGGRAPRINLGRHCNSYNTTSCSNLTSDIESCQVHGIKVFLSIGGPYKGRYSLSSHADAKLVADYLWNNFLGGKSSSRPLGPAILDGINFDVRGGSGLYWDDLARYLSQYSKKGTKVYLTAAPQCPFPDTFYGKALDTGLFEYVSPKFFNNSSCEYKWYINRDVQYWGGNSTFLLRDWKVWTSRVRASKIFLGLNADFDVPGYIYLDFFPEIISAIKNSSNSKYGGVTLWSGQSYGYLRFYSEYIVNYD